MRAWREICLALLLSAATIESAFAADQSLIDAAKQEGAVNWYTTLIVDQFVRPAVDGFVKKYGIRVNYIRLDPEEIAVRIASEAKANKVQADIFDGFNEVVPLSRAGLTLNWIPDGAAAWPKEYRADDKSWVATNLYVLSPAYNTDLVPPGTQPRTFQDLLDPKWKGKMVWSSMPSASGGAGFIGLVLKSMGEQAGMDYLKKLAQQNIVGVQASARSVLDQVVSGEYAVALQIFDNHPGISAAKGAHVEMIPMQPALAAFGVVSITKQGPHQNAAKLLEDYLVSDEGQKIFRDADYLPVAPDVPPRDPRVRPDGTTYKALYLTPEDVRDAMPAWSEIYKRYFR